MPDLKSESSPLHQPVRFDWTWSCGTPVGNAVEGTQDTEPLGEPPVPEAPPPVVVLGTFEDEVLEDDGVLEEGGEFEDVMFPDEGVGIAEFSEGVELADDDPPLVADTLDPVANTPQLLPAQEIP